MRTVLSLVLALFLAVPGAQAQSTTVQATSVRTQQLEVQPLGTPAAPTVVPQGTTGATTYSYRISAVNAIGETLASTAGTTSMGNASLDSSNFNRVTWAGVPGAAAYRVYGRSSGTEELMTTVAAGGTLIFDDDGDLTPSGSLPAADTSGGITTVGGCVTSSGTGSPESAVVGSPCDQFIQTDGPPFVWLKETGSGTNTGWVEFALETIEQAEAEAGTATTRRAFTAERVAQAIAALGGGGGTVELLVSDSGMDTNTSAATVDTVAISGLTALDTLRVIVDYRAETQTVGGVLLRNETDGVDFHRIDDGATTAAGNRVIVDVTLSSSVGESTIISGVQMFSKTNQTNTNNVAGVVNGSMFTVTTAWTGDWTLALRHAGVTSGGTFHWSWRVYKVNGQ